MKKNKTSKLREQREEILIQKKAERIERLLSQLSFIDDDKIPEIALRLSHGTKTKVAPHVIANPPHNGNPLRFEVASDAEKKSERFKTLYEAMSASETK